MSIAKRVIRIPSILTSLEPPNFNEIKNIDSYFFSLYLKPHPVSSSENIFQNELINLNNLNSFLSMKLNCQIISKFKEMLNDYLSSLSIFTTFKKNHKGDYFFPSLKCSIEEKSFSILKNKWNKYIFSSDSESDLDSVLQNIKYPYHQILFLSSYFELNSIRNILFDFRFSFLCRNISKILILDSNNQNQLMGCIIKTISDPEFLSTFLVISSLLNTDHQFVSKCSNHNLQNWFIFQNRFVQLLAKDSEIGELYSNALNSVSFL
jgi:hypothetical protein